MSVLAFAFKYAVRMLIIAYLMTTNWRFLHIQDYLSAPKFWPLYWATCVVVLLYMLIIETLYCVLVLNHSKKACGMPRAKRKVLFFLTGIIIVTAINLVLLHFVLSTAEHSFITAKYWSSGFIFFLLLFIAYEAWVWYMPRATIGFWVMECWVSKVVRGIEKKASPSSTINEADVQSDAVIADGIPTEVTDSNGRSQFFIADTSIILMDILLIISQRDGVYMYLRSGQCFFTEVKLSVLFSEVQLTWFVEYRKGARVSLAHLVSVDEKEAILNLNEQDIKGVREVWAKSALELHSFLAVSPVYRNRIKQQIEHKKQLDKALLSNSIQPKSVIKTY